MSETILVDLMLVGRILMAGFLGALVGFERERSDKAAGLRTHTIVAITSALFAGITQMWTEMDLPTQLEVDPVRAVQAIAVGVGFLGSGIVFVSDSKNRPKGLTTAASIWATAAIGTACGFSRYVLATGATLVVLLALRALLKLEPDGATHEGD